VKSGIAKIRMRSRKVFSRPCRKDKSIRLLEYSYAKQPKLLRHRLFHHTVPKSFKWKERVHNATLFQVIMKKQKAKLNKRLQRSCLWDCVEDVALVDTRGRWVDVSDLPLN
jgi:hypothetical protein